MKKDHSSSARHLVTEIPGPRSRELFARRSRTVSAGVGTALPVFVTRAGGGVLVDVDGNSLIDLVLARVGSVGNAAPRVVAAVQGAGGGGSRTPASW